MHASVMQWARQMIRFYGLRGRTLEVGSADVNGSLRPEMEGPYTGVDLRPVAGVDVVADGHYLPFRQRRFDTVVCTETLSHDPAFWVTLREINRVMRVGGHLLLTVRGLGFGRNDSPGDYYRFTKEAIQALLQAMGLTVLDITDDPQYPGVLALGRKDN